MNLRDKVIKGLECCLDYEEPRCESCPYAATEEDKKCVGWDCYKYVLQADALAVLQGHNEWISVEDALPTEDGQDCWVWSDDWESSAEPEWDTWVNDRGQPRRWANGDEKDRDFIASGWYTCTGMNITHWMPIETPKKPLPPKAGEQDG